MEVKKGVSSSDSSLQDQIVSEENGEVETTQEKETSPNASTTAHLLQWDGPEDLGNPHNWKGYNRAFQTAVPALMGFSFAFATSTCFPGLPKIQKEFEVSAELSILVSSIFLVGLSIGPLLGAPLSEIYGRRIVYQVTYPWFMIFAIGAANAKNIETLLVLRFLGALGGSGALAVGAGTVADIWPVHHRGPAALLFILCPFLGPVFAPLAGAYLMDTYNDWRWTQWINVIVAAPIFLMTLFLRESSKNIILVARNKKRGTHIPELLTRQEKIAKIRIGLFRPFHMLLTEPLVMLLALYMGFSFAMIFSFFGSFRIVFVVLYGFNQKEVGLSFLGIFVGFLFSLVIFISIDRTLYMKATKKAGGKPEPEHRLYPAMVGSIFLLGGLFWFAWAPEPGVHWIVPVLSGVPFGCGAMMLTISATTYLVDAYPPAVSATAMAATSVLRYLLGAAFPLFTVQMYESSLGIHWAGSVFAFFSILLMPVPWVFFKWGKNLRARSGYPT